MRSRSPMKLATKTVRGDQHDFLHALDLPINRQLDPAIMALRARLQDLDDQERIVECLLPKFMVLECRRNIGFEISIRSVRGYDTSFTLRIARAAVRQAG